MFREDSTMKVSGEPVLRMACIECEPGEDDLRRHREVARGEDCSLVYLGRWKRL